MWKLTDTEGEEIVLRVAGVLCQKELPPVSIPTDSNASRRARRYLRQHIKITGLGDEQFDNSINKIHEIYVHLAANFDETSLEQWDPEFHDSFPAIQASARYFTPMSMVSGAGQVPFAPFVDPDDRLLQAMGSEYMHTAENRVDYLQRVMDSCGKVSYRDMDPIAFKTGDIVEAAMSFSVVPINVNNLIHGKKKLILALRGLALLDSNQRNKAAIKEMRERVNRISISYVVPKSNKRVIRFQDDSDEDIEETLQIKRMRLSNDSDSDERKGAMNDREMEVATISNSLY